MARKVVDHRTILKGKKQSEVANPVSPRWWKLKGAEAANSITSVLTTLHQNQSGRLMQMIASARLYGNLTLFGGFGLSASQMSALRSTSPAKSAYNIVQSCIDAVTSKIAKSKPEPLFLTSGGNFHQQRRAQKLTDYVNGVLYENRAHELAVQVFRDACVWGSGIAHVFGRHGRVCVERVMPAELYVDEVEGFYRDPRQAHRIKAVDRMVLEEAFPDAADKLANVGSATVDGLVMTNHTADMLQVRESWHLPSGPDAADGRHMVTVGDLVLLDEEWTKDAFPFVKLDWSPKMYGYWGQGLAEQVQGFQLEVNQLSWLAQRSFYMAGSFKVFMKAGSKVVKEHLNNDVGTVIEYVGDTPPQYFVPPVIPAETLRRIEDLKRSAYEQAGISQLSASSQKPAGLNSGRALREMTDIESDRFSTVGQAFEQFFVDLGRQVVSVSSEIAESGSLTVKVPGKDSFKTVDWEKCALDEDEFITKVFPVSGLPNEPAGRIQTIQEWVQAGIIPPDRGRRLMNFPDLQADDSLASAQQDYLTKILDGIVDDGEFTPPEPYDDLREAQRLALLYYAHGRAQGLEPERLQMLRDFMDQLDGLTQAAQPPEAGEGATPQANPMPAPTSDLVPNVPGA